MNWLALRLFHCNLFWYCRTLSLTWPCALFFLVITRKIRSDVSHKLPCSFAALGDCLTSPGFTRALQKLKKKNPLSRRKFAATNDKPAHFRRISCTYPKRRRKLLCCLLAYCLAKPNVYARLELNDLAGSIWLFAGTLRLAVVQIGQLERPQARRYNAQHDGESCYHSGQRGEDSRRIKGGSVPARLIQQNQYSVG